jgi:hypothetical protein
MNIDDEQLLEALYIEVQHEKHKKQRIGDLSRKQLVKLLKEDINKAEVFGAKTVLNVIDEREKPLPTILQEIAIPEKDEGYELFLNDLKEKTLWNPEQVIRKLLFRGNRGGNHPIVHALEKDMEKMKSIGRNKVRYRFLKHWYHFNGVRFYDAQQEPEVRRITAILKKDIDDKLIDNSGFRDLHRLDSES